jgi:hypothetical protein
LKLEGNAHAGFEIAAIISIAGSATKFDDFIA